MTAEEIILVVQSDDFGMCHAVNEGVVRAFTEGVLTQASAMVPCPWFQEAEELALRHGIPTGVHLTLTCEWDRMRWRPLTHGRSLVGADGTFLRTVEDAASAADAGEATAELVAQTERFRAKGLVPSHFDLHMGVVCGPAYAAVCARFSGRFIYPVVEPFFPFTSIRFMTEVDPSTKTEWLLDYLRGLEPGVHFLLTHCAVPGPEIGALVARDSPLAPWTESLRASDLVAVTDPAVRKLVAERGVRLASVDALDW